MLSDIYKFTKSFDGRISQFFKIECQYQQWDFLIIFATFGSNNFIFERIKIKICNGF